ncbi:MAG: serine protease [Myxococcales bacterium]|nr:serine protease [Myxococcales bacterium]
MWWLLALPALADPPAPIVGGVPAAPGDWPDVVALYTIGDSVGCTGTLVAPDLVLTAAHCVAGLSRVVVGTTDLASGGRTIGVASVTSHPNPYTELDVALVQLSETVTDIEPRLLMRDCLVDALSDGIEVEIAGFGATDAFGSEFPDALMRARIQVRDADCSNLSAGCYPEVSPGAELIAGGDGVDSCTGDSGGPLYLLGDDEAWLAGITSRAAQPAQHVCGDGGIYVRSDAIADWIVSLGLDLPHPDCEGVNVRPHLSADDLVVRRNTVDAVALTVSDGNAEDQHELEVVDPGRVQAWLEGEVLLVRTSSTFSGETAVRVRVTDDGDPPMSSELDVVVRAAPSARLPVGCVTGGGPVGWLAFAALALLTRRRCS